MSRRYLTEDDVDDIRYGRHRTTDVPTSTDRVTHEQARAALSNVASGRLARFLMRYIDQQQAVEAKARLLDEAIEGPSSWADGDDLPQWVRDRYNTLSSEAASAYEEAG